jgi:hypothetical protein
MGRDHDAEPGILGADEIPGIGRTKPHELAGGAAAAEDLIVAARHGPPTPPENRQGTRDPGI